LPDLRVEKSALTGLNVGHEVLFAGKISGSYDRNIFAKIFEMNWTAGARYGIPTYWRSVKKQFEKIIRDVRPDIVHAHNIFSAKLVSEFGIPFVYDDHEYWSKSSEISNEIEYQNSEANRLRKLQLTDYFMNKLKTAKRRYINKKISKVWTKWERELVNSCPTITVSEKIAEELRLIGNTTNKVFVVPNFPLQSEVMDIKRPTRHTGLSSVYAGGDGHNKIKFPQKNIDDFIGTFSNQNIGSLTIIGWDGQTSLSSRISYTGFLTRQDMFNEMSKHSIGLIPWKAHWSHVYSSPNKAYEYAHAGLFVMCTSSLKPVTEYLKDNCFTFDDSNQMVLQLNYFKDNLTELHSRRLKLFDFAKSNLLWENHEKNILRAYELA
jgi:glycosyltransferase involved in cell wall biosynthesis